MTTTTFRHSGDLGDIVYSLPAIRTLGGGELYLVPREYSRSLEPLPRGLTERDICAITPLLERQRYVDRVVVFCPECPGSVTAHDLDVFRQSSLVGVSLCAAHLDAVKQPLCGMDVKWLKCDANPLPWGKKYIVAKTPRYENHNFCWEAIVERFGDDAVFLGHAQEYDQFCEDYGDIDYLPTADLLVAAEYIAGAELFIGNQSVLYAIAEGLKQNAILQVAPLTPNCFFKRDNLRQYIVYRRHVQVEYGATLHQRYLQNAGGHPPGERSTRGRRGTKAGKTGGKTALAEQVRASKLVLLFFHGDSLAHSLRSLVVARALRSAGYRVKMAGHGKECRRVLASGLELIDVETMPQERMDWHVARGDYAYYNDTWIDRCVTDERRILRTEKPDLVIEDMKPTVALAARLEGVDDAMITQAYNQPGYAYPIVLCRGFSPTGGELDKYLLRHADELRPQHSFYMIADAPELHPRGSDAPGFHYVGPLLDVPTEPDQVSLLDDGWDPYCPLIYVTCGSSGRYPDYLDDLIRTGDRLLYRVFITTAGRWSAERLPDNIRSADFVPGEWVLRRAILLVGVPGIGAIYQALRCGVPVIGAPEHLDQEYHLNRIASLGLGIKLDRRDFSASNIIAAIESVKANYGDYRQRCLEFAVRLRRWKGGEVAVSVVDRHFWEAQVAGGAGSECSMHEKDFLEYLAAPCVPGVTRKDLESMLESDVKKGMPHRTIGDTRYYDKAESWNWLYNHDTRFFSADYWACEKRRRQFFTKCGRRLVLSRQVRRYRITYRFESRGLADTAGEYALAKLFVPYPIETPPQSDVELVSCDPEPMSEYLSAKHGFIYGFPVYLGVEECISLSYTCELSVAEQRGVASGSDAVLSVPEAERYLRIDPILRRLPLVSQFLSECREADPFERARKIYNLLLRDRRFQKVSGRMKDTVHGTIATLTSVHGNCLTLTRTFVALCRAAGIPAREAAGALLDTRSARGCTEPVHSENLYLATVGPRSMSETEDGSRWSSTLS